mgnify:CR=1 FL=1
MQFEYHKETLIKEKRKALEFYEEDKWLLEEKELLNLNGQLGWELVNTIRITDNLESHLECKMEYYFKKEID